MPSSKPLVEPAVDLGEVRLQAAPSIAMRGVDDVDAHERRGEQSLDFGHRGHESLLFGVAQRFEHRADEGVAASIEHRSLGETGSA